MTTTINNIPIWSSISLPSLLSSLGHEPLWKSAEQFCYQNPLAAAGSPAGVFMVNPRLNTWYDRTTGRGGTLRDFAETYWPETSEGHILEKIKYLQQLKHKDTFAAHTVVSRRRQRKRSATKLPYFLFSKSAPLGTTAQITHFLKKNGLWHAAESNLCEVTYYYLDQKGLQKEFQGAGWQNENGGWEVISPNFRGTIGPLGITHIERSSRAVAIFMDFREYLANRSEVFGNYASVLIANHSRLISTVIKRAGSFSTVSLFVGQQGSQLADMFSSSKEIYPRLRTIEI